MRARDPVDLSGGPARRRDAPQPPPRTPVTRQSSDALPPDVWPATDRSGGEGEARVDLDRDMNCPRRCDQDREARHDRLCLPRLSGSSARSWRSRHTATSDQNQSRTPGHRQCRTVDGPSPCPARRTATATRSSGSTGTGLLIICRTAPSTPVQAAPRSSMWTSKSSRSGPPCHRIHGREGQRAPDG